jgi:succinate dehydrogenase flavin-adding protein (antitoxin of CptAB toxin-antitoxin module)
MVWYRCERAGMLEVEVLLKKWAAENLKGLTREQLVQFHDEVLAVETPDLYQILIGKQAVPDVFYLQAVHAFVHPDKNR